MSTPKLDPARAVLLVVDVQEGFRKAIPGFAEIAAATATMVRGAAAIGVPILVTEQYPKGLGRTVDEVARAPAGRDRAAREDRLLRRRRRGLRPRRPRAGDRLRDRGARLRQPDGSRSDRSGDRGPRRHRCGRFAQPREPRARAGQGRTRRRLADERRDGPVRAARRGGHRRLQAGSAVGPGARALSRAAGYVLLEDGSRLDGELCAAAGDGTPGLALGEVVFNTGMTGYQESVTDPSYAGQIITFTYPLIGNYGVSADAMESDARPRPRRDHARGQERRGRRHRRARLARLARRLRRPGDHRRRYAGARPPHPRPGRDAGRDLQHRDARRRGAAAGRRRALDEGRRPGPDGHPGGADRVRRRRPPHRRHRHRHQALDHPPAPRARMPGHAAALRRRARGGPRARPRPRLPRQRSRRPGRARPGRRDGPGARRASDPSSASASATSCSAGRSGWRPSSCRSATAAPTTRSRTWPAAGSRSPRRTTGSRSPARTARRAWRPTSRSAGRPTSAPPSSPTSTSTTAPSKG